MKLIQQIIQIRGVQFVYFLQIGLINELINETTILIKKHITYHILEIPW